MGPHFRARRYAPGDRLTNILFNILLFIVYLVLIVSLLLVHCLSLVQIIYQLHFRTCEGYIYFGRRGAIGDPVLGGSRGGGKRGVPGGVAGGGGGARGARAGCTKKRIFRCNFDHSTFRPREQNRETPKNPPPPPSPPTPPSSKLILGSPVPHHHR